MLRRRASEYCDALYSTAYTARVCPDVVLRAFGKDYPVHRVILASQSAYFATLLRWGSWQHATGGPPRGYAVLELSSLPCHELLLGEDVNQQGFEWILEYFYASPHVALTNDNAFDVLAAAHYLGATAVQTACVEFLAQHLDPQNLAACLLWATRADHGEASDLLAAACRRLLALRLPRHLAAWAPALSHIEPRTLLDIMSSDYLAVPTEYDRYVLVKEVANILCSAAAPKSPDSPAEALAGAAVAVTAAAAASWDDAGGEGEGGRGVAAGGGAVPGTLQVQRMLSSVLRLSDEGPAGHLELPRSCAATAAPVPATAAGAAPVPCVAAPPASAGFCEGAANVVTGALPCLLRSPAPRVDGADSVAEEGLARCVGGGCRSERALCTSLVSSACAEGGGSSSTSLLTCSQASSRSTIRLSELSGCGGGAAEERAEEGSASGSGVVTAPAVAMVLYTHQPDSPGGHGSTATYEAAARADSPASPMGAFTLAAAACARLLLHDAVRYEHLTVPQLMAVEQEGLVAAGVLHAALWKRTRLDLVLHSRVVAGDPAGYQRRRDSSSQCAKGAAGDRRGGVAEAPGGGGGDDGARVERGPPPAGGFRAFRICWRLPAGALKKLRPRDMLQSELHQYAGALWQLRLCCSDRSLPEHLGLFVGRHLIWAPAAAGAAGVGAAAGLLLPQQQPGLQVSPARQRQRQPGAQEAAPPPPPPQQPWRHRGPHWRRQPAPAPPPPPLEPPQSAGLFFSYTDQGCSLRARCRIAVCQSDTSALRGRLCLGEAAFTADFAAGGYFGRGQMLARADLAQLRGEQEVQLFMALTVLAPEEGGGLGGGRCEEEGDLGASAGADV